MANPAIDIAQLAQAQGAVGIGPINSVDEFAAALDDAIDRVGQGEIVVIDTKASAGYQPDFNTALFESRAEE